MAVSKALVKFRAVIASMPSSSRTSFAIFRASASLALSPPVFAASASRFSCSEADSAKPDVSVPPAVAIGRLPIRSSSNLDEGSPSDANPPDRRGNLSVEFCKLRKHFPYLLYSQSSWASSGRSLPPSPTSSLSLHPAGASCRHLLRLHGLRLLSRTLAPDHHLDAHSWASSGRCCGCCMCSPTLARLRVARLHAELKYGQGHRHAGGAGGRGQGRANWISSSFHASWAVP